MRSDEEAERVLALGAAPDRVWVTGNTKFDALVLEGAADREEALRAEMGLQAGAPVLMAGSTHEGEEELVLGVYRRLLDRYPRLQLVIAPRYVERAGRITALAAEAGLTVRLRTDGAAAGGAQVTVLDTIGELAVAYRLATLVFVGGSFVTRGGQNVLEPAAQGRPVLFGPHMENFKDSVQVLQGRGGLQVATPDQLFKALETHTHLAGLVLFFGFPALADPEVAERVTLRHLFSHTAGWLGDYFDDTGPGNDAVRKIVQRMKKLPQVTPLGQVWSSVTAGFLWCLPPGLPRNKGFFDCMEVITKEGTCLSPVYPATAASQAVTLGLEITECVMLAMAQVDPKESPATWGRHVNPLYAGKRRDKIDPRTGSIMEYTAHTFHAVASSGAASGFDAVDGGGLDESWRQQPARQFMARTSLPRVCGVLCLRSTNKPTPEWRGTANSPGSFTAPA